MLAEVIFLAPTYCLGAIDIFYQNLDKQMKYYLNYFNEEGTAFVLKPEYLRYVPVKIPCPPPPNPKLTFAPQKYDLPWGGFHM